MSLAITGYASLFDQVDMARDSVAPGAFRETLRRRRPGGIRMLFQHDPGQPVGVWTEIAEDHRGLRVSGHLLAEVARSRELAALIAAGALDGLSIGFRAARGRLDAKTGIRRLERIDLWEVSLVTFPMLDGARLFARPTVSPTKGPHR